MALILGPLLFHGVLGPARLGIPVCKTRGPLASSSDALPMLAGPKVRAMVFNAPLPLSCPAGVSAFQDNPFLWSLGRWA